MQRQKKVKNGEKLTKADIIEEIKNLQGITYDEIGNTIDGEYNNYFYTIDKDFNVIVGPKVTGDEIKGWATVTNEDGYLDEVEIKVIGSLNGGTIENIEALSEGVTLTYDKYNYEKYFTVKDNGTYIFRIIGSTGRKIKVACTVTNAIPVKQDLLNAVDDINTKGICKCKVIGSVGDSGVEDVVMYSFDTIIYNGNLILDGENEFEGANLKAGKIYEFGNMADVSDGTNYAQHTVLLKVIGNLIIRDGVTLTSVSGSKGGPLGMVIYCTGQLENNGKISMTSKGAYAKGKNIYLLFQDGKYEYISAIGGNGGAGQDMGTTVNGKMVIYETGISGENGIGRATGGGAGGGNGLMFVSGGSLGSRLSGKRFSWNKFQWTVVLEEMRHIKVKLVIELGGNAEEYGGFGGKGYDVHLQQTQGGGARCRRWRRTFNFICRFNNWKWAICFGTVDIQMVFLIVEVVLSTFLHEKLI